MKPALYCSQLEAFHDEELSQAEWRAMAEHVENCPACRRELACLCALDGILRPRRAQPDISAAVMDRVAELVSAGPRRTPDILAGWWKGPALALASCAVYAVCVETGLLPTGYDPLASALAAQSEAQKLSSVLFGNSRGGSEEMLAMLLDGDKK